MLAPQPFRAMKIEPTSRRQTKGEGSILTAEEAIPKSHSKLRRLFSPLRIICLAAGLAFAAWAVSDLSFSKNPTLTQILIGGSILAVALGLVASPYLVIYAAAGDASSGASKSILAIGLLAIILYGVWAFSKSDDHPEASLGFFIAPILQLLFGALPLVVVARTLDRFS
ncbi:hypothetical protein FYK55_00490 [Roseiconus nitratireducens]|uniref:Uncharacterized protein n=1 Tax=Roseiconus nitratireducens TaxID=2605748 RepID=A0A5M6DHB3_9BACT|nr:hypothetical protein [Roseiconus nitratireducens]KAA5546937.1 hypothetical protein FYK55_00490 [Roseiconus nitratireducens]